MPGLEIDNSKNIEAVIYRNRQGGELHVLLYETSVEIVIVKNKEILC